MIITKTTIIEDIFIISCIYIYIWSEISSVINRYRSQIWIIDWYNHCNFRTLIKYAWLSRSGPTGINSVIKIHPSQIIVIGRSNGISRNFCKYNIYAMIIREVLEYIIVILVIRSSDIIIIYRNFIYLPSNIWFNNHPNSRTFRKFCFSTVTNASTYITYRIKESYSTFSIIKIDSDGLYIIHLVK